LPIFEKLAADDQDSVRLLTVEGCVAIASMLAPEENTSLLLPTIRNCLNDKSWRVRYMAAVHFVEVC
jgi:serine/threonine-protein phosphatase 2A regulatory subunit A